MNWTRSARMGAILFAAGLACGLGSPTAAAEPPSAVVRAAGEPYVGITLRDTADGVVVGWVYPGPAGGDGFNSSLGLRRGDNLDAVYLGGAVSPDQRRPIASAQAFTEFVASLHPGETLSIEARRSPESDPDAAVPKGGPGGDVTIYSITVADRDKWTGTVGRGLGSRTIAAPREGEFEAQILSLAGEVGVCTPPGGLDALLPYFARVQDQSLDPNSLPCVVQAFRRPLSVDAVEADVAVLASRAAAGSHEHIEALVAAVLDLPVYDGASLDAAMDGLDLGHLRSDLEELVAWSRSDVSVGGEHAEDQIRAIRTTEGRVGPYLAFLLHATDTMLEWEPLGRVYSDGQPLAQLPDDLAGAVTGDVLHIERFPNGTIGIVGGPGANRYDMSRITDVYDVGGADTYTFARSPTSPAGGNHHIIDLAGNDTYEGTTDFSGPGVGIMGVSIVDDRAGDDVYRSSRSFTIGAGLFGIGLVIDRAGDDRYENTGPDSGWSIGVGLYGAGLVIDADGDDAYLGEQLTQGVGGPRGFGAILDRRGDDSYKANGPNFASVYGTQGVYKAFSQGFGIGVRSYAAGGLGAIYDLAGDDRYEAGEFAQGCAYSFAMGLIHDMAGDDVYTGNRYGQASAAHQAVGLLIDDAGDDHYWSMTAASQAGVWDQSLAVLIDRAGNDSYEADGLAQGSASMQAIGVLLDLGGSDSYAAKGSARQGRGGGNRYHFDADGVLSFSALIDLGGAADTYSGDRENGEVMATGAAGQPSPADGDLYGLFADR
ncbi:MAG: hypothetical protein IPJ41_05465 [Phycisphaerales bacterium]|nr:hypothetical protein [Phycisphaerales bacterium]